MKPQRIHAVPLSCPKFPATGITNKRRRARPQPPPSTTPPPSPPTRFPISKLDRNISTPQDKSRRSLSATLLSSATADEESDSEGRWEVLSLPRSELSLSLTLPTGQTFRWRRTGPSRFTGVVGRHLLSLRHHEGDPSDRVSFLIHGCPSTDAARAALCDYLNVGVSLAELWRGFSDAEPRFAKLARAADGGARVLRQDPVECVFQFLCSSNNNIRRIEKMVDVLSSYGEYLGTVGGFDFHEFPSIERLATISEQDLRDAGFGYRAKYIVGTAKALQTKKGGGEQWLDSLRVMELHEVIDSLCTLPGVGPKVAACIALFSLDQHHAIPVDTHVWKIASRYLMPELAGMKLTPKLCRSVAEAFVIKFGKYAGWAQNLLFIGELSSQKAILSSPEVKCTKSADCKTTDAEDCC